MHLELFLRQLRVITVFAVANAEYVVTCFRSDRLHKVLEYVNEVHSLCGILGMDFAKGRLLIGDIY